MWFFPGQQSWYTKYIYFGTVKKLKEWNKLLSDFMAQGKQNVINEPLLARENNYISIFANQFRTY